MIVYPHPFPCFPLQICFCWKFSPPVWIGSKAESGPHTGNALIVADLSPHDIAANWRNFLKFYMKIIQVCKSIYDYKPGKIWNSKVIYYFSAQTQGVNQNETPYFVRQNNHICPCNFRHRPFCNETILFGSRFLIWNLRSHFCFKNRSKKTPHEVVQMCGVLFLFLFSRL